ncbi:MAG: hypothetical protein F9K44_07320 [Hyphomicrobiaceae bacterium]|nr:MAG: hypothetical protein F9K44_07320 [Hyphomicrobiaceae bacterium]
MALHPAFLGHGVFCYEPAALLKHYERYPRGFTRKGLFGLIAGALASRRPPEPEKGLAEAVKAMGFQHAWVRLYGHKEVMKEAELKHLAGVLRGANLHLAGWGYSHGDNWREELEVAKHLSGAAGLNAFVADIEPGRYFKKDPTNKSKWSERDLDSFIGALEGHFGRDSVAVSTWPVLKIQNDAAHPSLQLMRHIAPRVGAFVPQAYWMSYPEDVHYKTTGFSEQDYPRDDPSSFARLAIASWHKDGFTQPLILTGQAYWGEGKKPIPQIVVEKKLAIFVKTFPEWGKIAGLNWWHAGNPKAMSPAMVRTLTASRLDKKPFARA